MASPHPGSLPGSLPFPLGGSLIASPVVGPSASVGRVFKVGADGDWVREHGRFVRIGGIDSVGQDIRRALGTFQTFDEDTGEPNGEWAFDFTRGVPYFRDILIKGVDLGRVREIFRRVILSRRSVTDVPSLAVDLDGPARHLTVEFTARTDLGLLAGTVAGVF